MFLRNSWYVAAWGTEISADKPLARTLLNDPVVLYRRADGSPAALEDRCCHRSLPLSMGKVVGDRLQCGYHGLEFDGTGRCVLVPGQSAIPPGAQVRSYPLAERWGMVWIWMGDPAKADESMIPKWWWADHPDWKLVPGRGGQPMYTRCNYQLITDNLLDITHLSYVHTSSIGNLDITDFPIKTERLNRGVRMSRYVMNRPAAPFWQWAGKFKGNVDRWLITTTEMPCFTVNDAGGVDVGTDMTEDNRTHGVEMRVMNAPTPETETTTHYFYAHARNFGLDDPEVEHAYRTQFTGVFEEDKAVLEGQQAMMDRLPGAPEIDINTDAPTIAARRMLADLISAENGRSLR